MFFASLLRELYPRADVYHEAGERSRLINIFTHAHLSGFLPVQVPLWAWKRAVSPILEKSEKEIYIDSNNQIYALLPLAPYLYPGLRVIHLVRDPRDYVRSHLNWAKHRPKSFIANYLTPFWQPNAWLLKEMLWSEWIRLSQFERYCWIWDYKNRYIGQLEGSSTPYLRIYFEDFFGAPNPLNALQKMLEFLDLELVDGIVGKFQHPVNPNKGKSFPKWAEWSNAQCQQLSAFCGETMQKYGYGNETAWREKLDSSGEGAA
jgi:hypothetical protein